MKVSEVVYTDVEGVEDFQYVLSVELGSGYDWDDLFAWWSPSRRRFFWLDGSGCSCDSISTGVYGLGDFTSGSRSELASAVRAKYDESYSSPKPGDLIDDLARVKKFRAAS